MAPSFLANYGIRYIKKFFFNWKWLLRQYFKWQKYILAYVCKFCHLICKYFCHLNTFRQFWSKIVHIANPESSNGKSFCISKFCICKWIFFAISSFAIKEEMSLDHKKYVLVGKKILVRKKKLVRHLSNYLKQKTPSLK